LKISKIGYIISIKWLFEYTERKVKYFNGLLNQMENVLKNVMYTLKIRKIY